MYKETAKELLEFIEKSPSCFHAVKTMKDMLDMEGFEEIKEKRTTKANIGHCKKANTSPKRFIKEVRDCDMDVNVGDLVNVDIFAAGETVDVIGTSKGKGYNGTIVRNNAHQGPKTHGGSKNIRHIGSLATNGIT